MLITIYIFNFALVLTITAHLRF